MPKGTKFKSGYATVTDTGMGYREIAEVMTSEGFKMNHATARNYFLRAMEKIATPMVDVSGPRKEALHKDSVRMSLPCLLYTSPSPRDS